MVTVVLQEPFLVEEAQLSSYWADLAVDNNNLRGIEVTGIDGDDIESEDDWEMILEWRVLNQLILLCNGPHHQPEFLEYRSLRY